VAALVITCATVQYSRRSTGRSTYISHQRERAVNVSSYPGYYTVPYLHPRWGASKVSRASPACCRFGAIHRRVHGAVPSLFVRRNVGQIILNFSSKRGSFSARCDIMTIAAAVNAPFLLKSEVDTSPKPTIPWTIQKKRRQKPQA
jgi:hypothetical protein